MMGLELGDGAIGKGQRHGNQEHGVETLLQQSVDFNKEAKPSHDKAYNIVHVDESISTRQVSGNHPFPFLCFKELGRIHNPLSSPPPY